MAKIVTVYSRQKELLPVAMSVIRWIKISEALSGYGHQVDIATNERIPGVVPNGSNIRRVPLGDVQWAGYDVVKTLFHGGFDTLELFNGTQHPFIISKLGSVVAPEDREGIHFYGDRRKQLYETQQKINRASKYITLLSKPAIELWQECFGERENILLLPGAVDKEIPAPAHNPYPRDGSKRCIFAGNIYNRDSQPEANAVLVNKLNQLGKHLKQHGGIRLYMIGPGDVSRLDPEFVTYMGSVPYEKSWNYFHYAQVGIVVASGLFLHNNESTKIYHYLRAGLPVVSEAGFPNDRVVQESGLGFSVENGNFPLMVQKILESIERNWDRDSAIRYILSNHTWEKRAETYDHIIRREIGR